MMSRYKPVGWRNDHTRHYLAAKYGSAGGNHYMRAKWKSELTRHAMDISRQHDKVNSAEYDKLLSKGAISEDGEEGVYDTDYGNSAAVSFEGGKWHAYDLDMGQTIPVSMVTKKRIRDLDSDEGSLWDDADDHEYTGD